MDQIVGKPDPRLSRLPDPLGGDRVPGGGVLAGPFRLRVELERRLLDDAHPRHHPFGHAYPLLAFKRDACDHVRHGHLLHDDQDLAGLDAPVRQAGLLH